MEHNSQDIGAQEGVPTFNKKDTITFGQKPNPDIAALNIARASATTDAESDRHLHALLAIPATNAADVAIKLQWLIGGNLSESEDHCPFVATYESVGRDLGIAPGNIARHSYLGEDQNSIGPVEHLSRSVRAAQSVGAPWIIRRRGEFVLGRLTTIATAGALIAMTAAGTLGILSVVDKRQQTPPEIARYLPEMDARLAYIETQISKMTAAPTRDNYGYGELTLPPAGTRKAQ